MCPKLSVRLMFLAEIKKLRKNPEYAIHRKDELESFAHVNRSQETLLKSDKDKYLVYKWECKLMDGKASYAFKTTAVSMKIAALIAGKIKVGGEYSSLRYKLAFFDGLVQTGFLSHLHCGFFHPTM